MEIAEFELVKCAENVAQEENDIKDSKPAHFLSHLAFVICPYVINQNPIANEQTN